jgi:dolichyl-phosphate-mannose-protein mannosyltransferase
MTSLIANVTAAAHALSARVASSRFASLIRWTPAALIVILGSIIRLTNLGYPKDLLFDEKWYVPDAYALSKLGYEANWGDAGKLYTAFDPATWADHALGPQDATHPPLGKWMIWLSMQFFKPTDPVGWRLSTAIIGCLALILVILVAQRLFRSTTYATIAGLFMAFDGNAISMSRLAVLDGFLAFWVLLAAYFLLRDRDQRQTQLAIRAVDPTNRTVLLFRPWLWATAIALGAACATKVSGAVFVIVAGLYLIVSHLLTRSHLPVRQRLIDSTINIIVDGIKTATLVAGVVIASFTGWLLQTDGIFRDWADKHPAHGLEALIPGPLRSLIAYQLHATIGASKITSHNDLASPAWTWPLNIRPMALWIDPVKDSAGHLIALREITTLGNPFLWWAACIGFIVLLIQVLRRRGFIPAFLLIGWFAGWGPWLFTGNRTVYQTYSILYLPFMVLTVVYVLKTFREYLAAQEGIIKLFGKFILPVTVTAITLYAFYFLPLAVAHPLALDNYMHHMWIHAWQDLPSKPAAPTTALTTTSVTAGATS